MRTRLNLFFGLIIVVSISGCGTIITRIKGPDFGPEDQLPRVYSGVALDYALFWHPKEPKTNNSELLFLIDLPLIFVSDTLLLQLSIYEQGKYGNYGNQRESKPNLVKPEPE